jgi:hypothetical protein
VLLRSVLMGLASEHASHRFTAAGRCPCNFCLLQKPGSKLSTTVALISQVRFRVFVHNHPLVMQRAVSVVYAPVTAVGVCCRRLVGVKRRLPSPPAVRRLKASHLLVFFFVMKKQLLFHAVDNASSSQVNRCSSTDVMPSSFFPRVTCAHKHQSVLEGQQVLEVSPYCSAGVQGCGRLDELLNLGVANASSLSCHDRVIKQSKGFKTALA